MCLAFAVAGFALPALAITGGEPLSANLAPYIVNVKMENGMCSGTLIGPDVVLTAAHCVDHLGTAEVVAYITAGPTKPCDVARIVDIAYEPGALPILLFHVHAPDILLLKLDHALCSAKTASLVRTPVGVNDALFAAGQGEGNTVFGQAEQIGFKVIDSSTASDQVSPIDNTARDLLDLGSKTYRFGLPILPNTSVCSGDSGGPVFLDDAGLMRVYGVIGAVLPNESLGAPRCDDAYLQMFTPVAPYYDWIQSKLLRWSSSLSEQTL